MSMTVPEEGHSLEVPPKEQLDDHTRPRHREAGNLQMYPTSARNLGSSVASLFAGPEGGSVDALPSSCPLQRRYGTPPATRKPLVDWWNPMGRPA